MQINNLDVTLAMCDPVKKRQIEINIMEEIEVSYGLDSLDFDLVFPENTNTYKKFSDYVNKFIQDNVLTTGNNK